MEFLSIESELLQFEREAQNEGFSFIAGIDEVGRGPLAGPVVAAAVVIPADATQIPCVNDSKKLNHKKRLLLAKAIKEIPGIQYHISSVSETVIDEINILQATHQAMRHATSMLKQVDFLLIDGLPVPRMPYPNRALIKGDSKSASIAAASILAKVYRDQLMDEYAAQYPEYEFEKNKGYGTASHLAALKKHGPTPIHRRSFAPVRKAITPPPTQLNLL